jgi:L-ribulose-5-phosphate 4-epimerase
MDKYSKEKNEILNCARWLSDHGYFASQRRTGGNVSTVIKQDNLVLMSPCNRPYHDLTIDDIYVVGMDLKNTTVAEPSKKDNAMHVSVYHQRPDVTAVIHTHSVYASVFSVLNKLIPALFDEITYEIGPVVDVVPYAMWGSSKVIESISNKLNNKCYCYILQNHGALCLGSNLEQAIKNAELLERVARIYYHALATGLEITRLPESSVQHLIEMRKLQ